jgi:hypothetical protein
MLTAGRSTGRGDKKDALNLDYHPSFAGILFLRYHPAPCFSDGRICSADTFRASVSAIRPSPSQCTIPSPATSETSQTGGSNW